MSTNTPGQNLQSTQSSIIVWYYAGTSTRHASVGELVLQPAQGLYWLSLGQLAALWGARGLTRHVSVQVELIGVVVAWSVVPIGLRRVQLLCMAVRAAGASILSCGVGRGGLGWRLGLCCLQLTCFTWTQRGMVITPGFSTEHLALSFRSTLWMRPQ